MGGEPYEDLAAFILAQNPYSAEIYLKPGWQAVTPIQITKDKPSSSSTPDPALKWPFDDGTGSANRLVRKAMRISYQYRKSDGKLATEHLIVGFEGESGGG